MGDIWKLSQKIVRLRKVLVLLIQGFGAKSSLKMLLLLDLKIIADFIQLPL